MKNNAKEAVPESLRQELARAGATRMAKLTPEQRSAFALSGWKARVAKAKQAEAAQEAA